MDRNGPKWSKMVKTGLIFFQLEAGDIPPANMIPSEPGPNENTPSPPNQTKNQEPSSDCICKDKLKCKQYVKSGYFDDKAPYSKCLEKLHIEITADENERFFGETEEEIVAPG